MQFLQYLKLYNTKLVSSFKGLIYMSYFTHNHFISNKYYNFKIRKIFCNTSFIIYNFYITLMIDYDMPNAKKNKASKIAICL